MGDTAGGWWDRHQAHRKRAEEHDVQLFFRALAPASPGSHNRRVDLITRVKELEASDHITSHDLTVVGDTLCVCEDCKQLDDAQDLRETVIELSDWEAGDAEAIGFSRREVHSAITDTQYTVISPPDIVLGVYFDDVLTAVFPCSSGGETFSPEAYLDMITPSMEVETTRSVADTVGRD